MITFSRFGKHGNLGNQLHQLATLIGFSEKYKCSLVLPEWKYAKYFENPPDQGNVKIDMHVTESDYHYIPCFWDNYAEAFRSRNVDITGWLQCEKYWQHCKEKVLQDFSFKKEFAQKTRKQFAKVLNKKTITISIRRGDFVTNPNFHLLPLEYYLDALLTFFPAYNDFNIIVFSDDFHYCKKHIKPLPNIYFAEGLSDVEQLCLMSMCDHFIISNSTFSWWGARLGEKEHSIIIRSPYHLRGRLGKLFDTKDYYPERWSIFDHAGSATDTSAFFNFKTRPVSLSYMQRLAIFIRYYELRIFFYSVLKKIKRMA